MSKVITDFLTYLLAVYGVLSLILNIADSLRFRGNDRNKGLKLALLVRNQEQSVEGFIRALFLNDSIKRFLPDGKLHAVDLDSTDDTADILERLKGEYNLEVYPFDRKDELFMDFDSKTS